MISPTLSNGSTAPGPKPFKPPTKRTNSGGNAPNPVLNAIELAQPSLKIHLQEEVLFLHPAPKGQPSEDPLLTGSVVLYLPKPRTLKKLTVRLIARQDIGYPDSHYPYESHTVLDKVVSLFQQDEGVHLEKGEHTFAFSILVPSATPPYERCPYGRVRHIVTAKAKGLGAMNSDVTSEEKVVFLIVNPGGPGVSRPPPPLDYRLEGLVDELGPYTMSLKANHLMVGGLLLFRFALVGPPTDVVIYSVKVRINQHFTLQSYVEPSRVSRPPVDKKTIMMIDANHPANDAKLDLPAPPNGLRSGSRTPSHGALKVVERGREWKISHLGRVPNDNVIRPSTQEGTEAGIRIVHEIAVEVTYRAMPACEASTSSAGLASPSTSTATTHASGHAFPLVGKKKDKAPQHAPNGHGAHPERDRKKMTVTKPIDIFSCCCFVDSLTLPMYSEEDPHPQPDAFAPPCVCDCSLEHLMSTPHGIGLLKEETEEDYLRALVATADANGSTNGVPVIKTDDERAHSSASATGSQSRGRQASLSPTLTLGRQVSPVAVNNDYGSTDETLMTVSERLGQL